MFTCLFDKQPSENKSEVICTVRCGSVWPVNSTCKTWFKPVTVNESSDSLFVSGKTDFSFLENSTKFCFAANTIIGTTIVNVEGIYDIQTALNLDEVLEVKSSSFHISCVSDIVTMTIFIVLITFVLRS